jgi:hypothetical protein
MPAYAALVPPIYLLTFVLNVALVAAFNPAPAGTDRRRVAREAALPLLPWDPVSCVMTAAVVLAGALSGFAAVASMLVVVTTLPLLRTLGTARCPRGNARGVRPARGRGRAAGIRPRAPAAGGLR